jgi:hypothetical protein
LCRFVKVPEESQGYELAELFGAEVIVFSFGYGPQSVPWTRKVKFTKINRLALLGSL